MKKKEMKNKVMAVAMSTAMAASICPAVPAMAVTKDQVAKDGIYTKTAHVTRTEDDEEDEWNEYDLQVALTVKDGKFSNITVTPGEGYDSSVNDPYLVKKAVSGKKGGFRTLLLNQSATETTINNWDTVSGATRSSKAIKEAALTAIQSAPEAETEVIVDTAALEQLIKQAEALNENDYTAESWSTLKIKLTAARTALSEKKSQDTVDTAKKELDAAIKGLVKETKDEYSYVYVGMTWAEYWANEGVYQAGSTESSEEQDSHGEYDKGAFDVVTRATTNHGLHRGSFQCNAVIETNDGKKYNLAYWKDKDNFVTTDGETVAIADIKANIKDYKVTGLKYVPVKVKTSELEALKAAGYTVVENGETLRGGYGEGKLSSYTETANVTANTYGLKEAVKSGDGFTFTARKNEGTESGIKDQALKTATGIEPAVKEAKGSYGEFLRVDLNGNYGDLGANMQAVTWTYYGNDSTYSTPLQTYGTKFAADNWMHKSMGIQLGLTDSVRCQLPQGTDGTGYWKLTVRALGYEDYTYEFQATADNIVTEEKDATAEEIAALQAKVTEAEGLNESDYTADSWKNLQTELQESKDLLAKGNPTEAEVKEQTTHLTDAISNLVKETKDEYSYVYVGMTWAEYWANENVLAAGDASSSNEADSHGEYDKGAFDVVTRATANHGLHRGSYQCIATIYDTEGNTYKVASWNSASELVLTDGSTVAFDSKNKLVNGKAFDHYEVTGLKYVPVKVKTTDLPLLKEKYTVVENDGTLSGGFGENNLKAYTETANVTANTYGLKEAVKSGDGFTFTARKNEGTESGIKDQALKTATGIEPAVKEAKGSYGEFLRVDLNGNYGDLGANMQAVTWTYYGNDSTYSTPLQTYGTKFAADNWMHKSMGIQLGLTDSVRCQLPQGTDGTGYWKLTVRALGYEDYTYEFQATADNIVTEEKDATAEEIAALQAKVTEAEGLNESDYTAESWKNLQTELQESKDLLAKGNPTEAEVKEQTTHLTDAINNLVKAEQPTPEVDITKIAESIETAETLKESDYTTDSWSAFQSALANAKAVMEAKESQEAVDAATQSLNEAMNALVKAGTEDPVKKVTTDALEKAIVTAGTLKESDYTAESWKALQTALASAKTALEEKKDQSTVDSATDELNKAISALVKKDAGSKATTGTGSTTGTSGSKGNTGSKTSAKSGKAAKTGDPSSMFAWLGLAVTSLGAGIGGFKLKRKKKDEEEM